MISGKGAKQAKVSKMSYAFAFLVRVFVAARSQYSACTSLYIRWNRKPDVWDLVFECVSLYSYMCVCFFLLSQRKWDSCVLNLLQLIQFV